MMLVTRERRPLRRAGLMSEFERIHNLVDELMGEVFGSWMTPSLTTTTSPTQTPTWLPYVNMWQSGNELIVEFFLPGVPKDSIELNVTEDTLTLSGKCPTPWGNNNPTVYKYEFPYGEFYRQMTLPFSVNPEKVSAKYENGVLRVTLTPISSTSKSHKVQIS